MHMEKSHQLPLMMLVAVRWAQRYDLSLHLYIF